MIVKSDNGIFVIKFKYGSVLNEEKVRVKQRDATITWESKFTTAMVRSIGDSRDDYAYVRVDCNDGEQFKKHIGRQLAFIKILKVVLRDNVVRKAAIDSYNSVFCKHPLDVNKVMAYLNPSND